MTILAWRWLQGDHYAARPVILITGSSGFLGQAMAARLVRHYRVVGLDTVQPKKPLEGVETVLVDLTSDDNVRRCPGRDTPPVRRPSRFGGSPGGVLRPLRRAQSQVPERDGGGHPSSPARPATWVRQGRAVRVSPARCSFTPPRSRDGRSPRTGRSNPSGPTRSRRSRRNSWSGPNTALIPVVILRPAGVYDERCRSAFLAQQIARIYERQPTSYLFAGDPSHGQLSAAP